MLRCRCSRFNFWPLWSSYAIGRSVCFAVMDSLQFSPPPPYLRTLFFAQWWNHIWYIDACMSFVYKFCASSCGLSTHFSNPSSSLLSDWEPLGYIIPPPPSPLVAQNVVISSVVGASVCPTGRIIPHHLNNLVISPSIGASFNEISFFLYLLFGHYKPSGYTTRGCL